MNAQDLNAGVFEHIWRLLRETSEVAVAQRYHAPWRR